MAERVSALNCATFGVGGPGPSPMASDGRSGPTSGAPQSTTSATGSTSAGISMAGSG